MSDKILEQPIIIKFCVKIGKSASETLALLTLVNGEYAMKKLIGSGSSRKGEKMCKMTQEVGSQKCKEHIKCGQYESQCAQIED
jgi:hypothetical protein